MAANVTCIMPHPCVVAQNCCLLPASLQAFIPLHKTLGEASPHKHELYPRMPVVVIRLTGGALHGALWRAGRNPRHLSRCH